MLRTKTSHLKLLHGVKKFNLDFLLSLFKSSYTDMRGFGFIDTEIYNNKLFSTLVYDSIIRRRLFQPEINHLNIQDEKIFYIVPFSIDPICEFIDSQVGGEKLSRLISVIGTKFENKLPIDDVYLNIAKFIDLLQKQNMLFNIKNILINNYRPQAGLYGKFSAITENQSLALKTISEYGPDTAQVELEIFLLNNSNICKISRSGYISIRADELELENTSDILKKVILECRNA